MQQAQVPDLEITLLTGIRATRADSPVKLAQQQRHLLFALLADTKGEHLVRDDQLLERLWGDGTDRRHSLHQAVSRMRLPLGEGRIIREADPAGYRLHVLPGERVDLWVWWDLLATCSRLYADDPRAAAHLLPTPLAMCKLGALDDLPDTLAMRGLRDGIVTDYLQGASQLAELQLALGNHRQALTLLPALVRDHPGWQHLRALLMTALYREQRVAEALALYDDLAELLGHQPGPAVRQIRDKILDETDTSLLEVTSPPILPADQAVAASGGGSGISLGRISSNYHSMSTGPDSYTTAADRAALATVRTIAPHAVTMAEEAARFQEAAARRAAESGISRILVLADPLPHTLHSVAQRVSPGGVKVVYTHYDPALVRHAARLHDTDPDVSCIHATMADPEQLLQDPAVKDLLQLEQPLASRDPVLVIDGYNIQMIPLERDVKGLYQLLVDELSRGSIVVMTVSSSEGMTPVVRHVLTELFSHDDLAQTPIANRSRAEFQAAIPDGLEIQPPGITDVYRHLAANLPADRQVKRDDPWHHLAVVALKR